MADTKEELHLTAKKLLISSLYYLGNPFPHYHIPNYAKEAVKNQDIVQMSAAQMLIRHRQTLNMLSAAS